jgi:hypothetical protein
MFSSLLFSVSSEGSPKLSRHTFNTDTSQQPIYSRSTSNNEPMYRSTSNTDTQPIYSRSSNTDSQPIYGRTNNEPIYRSTTNTDTQPIYRSTSNTDTQPIYSRSTSNTENQPIYRSTSSFTGVPEPRSQVQAPAQESKVEITGSVCVAETVRTLTELNHQPASPVAVRR